MSERARPMLSVCVPTYNRPDLLERSLVSVRRTDDAVAKDVEIIVSDNSTNDRSGTIAEQVLDGWPGPRRYVHNVPATSAVQNFNRCLDLATGRWILMLHDDDYLLGDAVAAIVGACDVAAAGERVLLFGVHVVDDRDRIRRRQVFRTRVYLPPETAVRRVLSNSSMVRYPGIVVHADAYHEAGPFDAGLRGAEDLDMFVRLFSRFGVVCVPHTTAAYMVHGAAATETMFNQDTIAVLVDIFDEVIDKGLLDESVARRCQAQFFHQFILAGAFRRLRERDRARALKILSLFDLPRVHDLGISPRWALVRLAFTALTLGAGRRQL